MFIAHAVSPSSAWVVVDDDCDPLESSRPLFLLIILVTLSANALSLFALERERERERGRNESSSSSAEVAIFCLKRRGSSQFQNSVGIHGVVHAHALGGGDLEGFPGCTEEGGFWREYFSGIRK